MGHADYECCACCDRKMAYSVDAETKATLCTDCAVDLVLAGVVVRSPVDLIAWIDRTDAATVRAILSAHGFSFCFYKNDVDGAVRRKGLAPDAYRGISPAPPLPPTFGTVTESAAVRSIGAQFEALAHHDTETEVRERDEAKAQVKALREALAYYTRAETLWQFLDRGQSQMSLNTHYFDTAHKALAAASGKEQGK